MGPATFGAWLGLCAVTLAAYFPCLRGGFVWDDDGHVTRPDLRSLHGLWRIWFEVGATQQYYPVLHSAFWLEHRLWGDAVLGYHLTNILLHATAAWLFGIVLMGLWAERVVPNALSGPAADQVERVVLNPLAGPNGRTSALGTTRSASEQAPLFAALLFALHPVCVESVAWISEQKNTLSTVFYLLSALAYLNFEFLRTKQLTAEAQKGGAAGPSDASGVYPSGGAGPRRPTSGEFRFGSHPSSFCYVLSLALFILAVLSKSVTATLPAALLVVVWWKRGTLSWKRDVFPLLPWFVIGLTAGLFTAWVERHFGGAEGAAYSLSATERCLVAGRAVCFYLGKLFWPANLVFIYPRWHVDPNAAWQYLFPLAVGGLGIGLWLIRKRTRGPLACLLFFVGTLFPALGFFNVFPFAYSYVADHFQYLASLGFFAGFASFAGSSFRLPPFAFRFSQIAALAAICLLGALTWRDSRAYKSSAALYSATLDKNPDCWMAHTNLGVALAASGRLEEAIAHYERALEIDPSLANTRDDLGSALFSEGRTAEALAQFDEALRLRPRYPQAVYNRGIALQAEGRIPDAIEAFYRALSLKPDFFEARYNLGMALAGAGQTADGVVQLEEAVRLRPGFGEAHYNLGVALHVLGREGEAAVEFARARALGFSPP